MKFGKKKTCSMRRGKSRRRGRPSRKHIWYKMGHEMYNWEEEDDDVAFEAFTNEFEDIGGNGAEDILGMKFGKKKKHAMTREIMKERKVASKKAYRRKSRFDNRTNAQRDGLFGNKAEVNIRVEEFVVLEGCSEEEDHLSKRYESEELHIVNDNEVDEGKFPRFNLMEYQNMVIILGIEFANLEVFKNVVRELNIIIGREIDHEKNNKFRVRAQCVEK